MRNYYKDDDYEDCIINVGFKMSGVLGRYHMMEDGNELQHTMSLQKIQTTKIIT